MTCGGEPRGGVCGGGSAACGRAGGRGGLSALGRVAGPKVLKQRTDERCLRRPLIIRAHVGIVSNANPRRDCKPEECAVKGANPDCERHEDGVHARIAFVCVPRDEVARAELRNMGSCPARNVGKPSGQEQ